MRVEQDTISDEETVSGQVERLRPLWMTLSISRQVEVGCRWVDMAVRTMLSDLYRRAGHSGFAAVLRTLPPITNLVALRYASDQLSEMWAPDEPAICTSTFFAVSASMEQLAQRFSIEECCFLMNTTSQQIYGDDRSYHTMQSQLTEEHRSGLYS